MALAAAVTVVKKEEEKNKVTHNLWSNLACIFLLGYFLLFLVCVKCMYATKEDVSLKK